MLKVENLHTKQIHVAGLDIASGECVAVVGPSGSGKSLLLRAITDLDENEGDVSIDSTSRRDVPAHVWRRKVALVPAESGWWADNVADHFLGELDDPGSLQRLGLPSEALRWTVARLSSGEKHRLAIVRALQQEPSVLLLDEPTRSLDEETIRLVESELHRTLARGTAMLLVTHDRAQARRMSKRTFQMKDGTLVGLTGSSS